MFVVVISMRDYFCSSQVLVCDWSFSGKELQFLLSHNGEKIFEVLRFKEETRSWFVEDSVQKGTECELCCMFRGLDGGGGGNLHCYSHSASLHPGI